MPPAVPSAFAHPTRSYTRLHSPPTKSKPSHLKPPQRRIPCVGKGPWPLFPVPLASARALIALANAQIDLAAGFTTVLDMDSRGGFNTVDLRDAINSGLVQGPRMQVVGQSINQRATNYYPDSGSVRFLDEFTEKKNTNSPC